MRLLTLVIRHTMPHCCCQYLLKQTARHNPQIKRRCIFSAAEIAFTFSSFIANPTPPHPTLPPSLPRPSLLPGATRKWLSAWSYRLRSSNGLWHWRIREKPEKKNVFANLWWSMRRGKFKVVVGSACYRKRVHQNNNYCFGDCWFLNPRWVAKSFQCSNCIYLYI